MKNTLYLLCAIIMLLSGCSNSNKTNPILTKTAEDINKKCPIQVDIVTILTGIEALPGDILKYNYKLIKGDITDTIMAKKVFKSRMLYQAKNSPELKPLRDLHTSFLHSYNDVNGKHLFQVEINYDEYIKEDEKDTRTDQEILAEIIPDRVWFNKLLLPIEMDEITIFADCKFAAPDTIEMIYDLDDSNVTFTEQNISALREYLINGQKADNSSKELMDRNAIFKHIYQAKSGKVYEITITPADYK